MKLVYAKTLPKVEKELLLVGDEITSDDIEKSLKDMENGELGEPSPYITVAARTPKGPLKLMVLNPSISPELRLKLIKSAEKKRVKVVSLDDAPPKLRGARYMKSFLLRDTLLLGETLSGRIMLLWAFPTE